MFVEICDRQRQCRPPSFFICDVSRSLTPPPCTFAQRNCNVPTFGNLCFLRSKLVFFHSPCHCRYFAPQHEYKLPNIEIVYYVIWLGKRIDIRISNVWVRKLWKWTQWDTQQTIPLLFANRQVCSYHCWFLRLLLFVYLPILSVSRLVDITAGCNFLGLCDQKFHIYMCTILDGYQFYDCLRHRIEANNYWQ